MTAPKGGLYTVKKFSAVTRLVARVSAPRSSEELGLCGDMLASPHPGERS